MSQRMHKVIHCGNNSALFNAPYIVGGYHANNVTSTHVLKHGLAFDFTIFAAITLEIGILHLQANTLK